METWNPQNFSNNKDKENPKNNKNFCQGKNQGGINLFCVQWPSITVLFQRQKQTDLYELKAGLIYIHTEFQDSKLYSETLSLKLTKPKTPNKDIRIGKKK